MPPRSPGSGDTAWQCRVFFGKARRSTSLVYKAPNSLDQALVHCLRWAWTQFEASPDGHACPWCWD